MCLEKKQYYLHYIFICEDHECRLKDDSVKAGALSLHLGWCSEDFGYALYNYSPSKGSTKFSRHNAEEPLNFLKGKGEIQVSIAERFSENLFMLNMYLIYLQDPDLALNNGKVFTFYDILPQILKLQKNPEVLESGEVNLSPRLFAKGFKEKEIDYKKFVSAFKEVYPEIDTTVARNVLLGVSDLCTNKVCYARPLKKKIESL